MRVAEFVELEQFARQRRAARVPLAAIAIDLDPDGRQAPLPASPRGLLVAAQESRACRVTQIRTSGTQELQTHKNLERAIGIEPTTFSLGS